MKKADLFRFQNLRTLLKIDGKMKYKCKSETFESLTVWYCLRQEYSRRVKRNLNLGVSGHVHEIDCGHLFGKLSFRLTITSVMIMLDKNEPKTGVYK